MECLRLQQDLTRDSDDKINKHFFGVKLMENSFRGDNELQDFSHEIPIQGESSDV